MLCRGDRREAIFLDDEDRQGFLATLGELCERTGFVVHSYVLMDNHYHLLLETPAGNLVAGMKWFQGIYTARFNVRHRLRGHLFAGRYKAVLVERESAYARVVSDYIHLNPARAHCQRRESAIADIQMEQFSNILWGRKAAEVAADRRILLASF